MVHHHPNVVVVFVVLVLRIVDFSFPNIVVVFPRSEMIVAAIDSVVRLALADD